MLKLLSFSKLISLLMAIVVIIPIAIIYFSLLNIDYAIWYHLNSFVLPELIANTVKLVIGVSLGTIVLGVSLSYINTFFEFRGKKFFTFFALMPMSIPAYIMAFVYVALFDTTGLWSLKIKEALALDFFLPSIRNFYGITLVLSLSFYPYVYLLARNSFLNIGSKAIEATTMLGLSRFETFYRVILPLSGPWILSGLILTLMETLGDFGAVSIFNYSTFTTAIYRSWFGLFSLKTAQQLASILISLVSLLMILGYVISKNKNFSTVGKSSVSPRTIKVGFISEIFIILYSSIVSLMAFFIPLAMIIYWSIYAIKADLDSRFFTFLSNSLEIATYSVIVIIFFSLTMSYATRKYQGVIGQLIKNISSLGYAVPGSVLAVGIFIFLNFMDSTFFNGAKIFSGSILAMIIGMSIRFLTIGLSPISNSFLRISNSQLAVLELNQNSKLKNFIKALAPMIKVSTMSASLMVFVEVIKEMPISLMTRPFGKETLSIRIFELTSEGEWERAALPSLFLIVISLIPTFILYINTEIKAEKL